MKTDPAYCTLLHASAVVVGERGIVILGPSGSGKSAIALSLVQRSHAFGRFAALVSDDQCCVQASSGRVICSAPDTLLGGIEVRGAGLFSLVPEPSAIVHLAIQLVDADVAVRYPLDSVYEVQGVALPRLDLPIGNVDAACRAIESALFLPSWRGVATL